MDRNEGKIFLVANPASGRGRGRRVAEALARALGRQGVGLEMTFTAAPGEAKNLSAQALAAGAGIVVACGGDGTIHEVIQPLAGATAALAVAPAGRCDDFAAELGLPRDPEAVAQAILAGRETRVDLGLVNGRHFCTVAALGFDAQVSRFVNSSRLPFRGRPAYIYGVLHQLCRFRPLSATVSWDEGLYQGPLFLAAAANTAAYGGGIRVAPAAEVSDGLLDLCLVRNISRLKALRLFPEALQARHGRFPEVRLLRTRSLTVETVEPAEVWADGEYIGPLPAMISAAPGALRLIRP